MRTLLFILSILLVGGGVIGANYRITSSILGFYLVLAGMLVSVLNLIPLLVLILRRTMPNNVITWGALLAGLISLGFFGFLVMMAKENPINDITTDGKLPPKFLTPLIPFVRKAEVRTFIRESGANVEVKREYDPSFFELQSASNPGILPLKSTLPPDNLYGVAVICMKQRFSDWKIVLDDKKAMHLEMEAESELFHFVDDIAIEVRAEEGGSKLEVRSRSRYGKSDLGANAKRIFSIMEAMKICINESRQAPIEVSKKPKTPAPETPKEVKP